MTLPTDDGLQIAWYPLTPVAQHEWFCQGDRHANNVHARWLTFIFRINQHQKIEVRQACYTCEDCKQVMERAMRNT